MNSFGTHLVKTKDIAEIGVTKARVSEIMIRKLHTTLLILNEVLIQDY
ncbi:MAG: hypothetical protein ACI8SE_001817 [Bacteroidia bacterium]|jgi:hypothetical protein